MSDSASIDHLLDELKNNLKEATLSSQKQDQSLARIKLASRQPATAAFLFGQDPISLLATYSLKRDNGVASKDASRSLANVFLLNSHSRQVFVDLGHGPDVADCLKQCDIEEEFLYSRLLFLLSYNTTLDFRQLVRKHSLAETVIGHLEKHSRSTQNLGLATNTTSMAMSELLRLIFNIQHFFIDLKRDFIGSLSPISTILLDTTWPHPILQAPLASVINALLILDLKDAIEADGKSGSSSTTIVQQREVVEHLIRLLDRATLEHSEEELEQSAVPLCTLLRKIYEVADDNTRARMQILILPTNQDRKLPLGQGDSFSARLLRLFGSPRLPTLHENLSNMLYELSERDAERFVNNIGYGYASGFLMSHDIAYPVNATSRSSANEDSLENRSINPVTGQTLATEDADADDLPEMTDEEKEREAERLFVLFERLKATGVVDVKNPVEDYRDQH